MSTLTSTQVQNVVDGRFTPYADPRRVNAVHVKLTCANMSRDGTTASVSSGDIIQAVAVPAWSRILSAIIAKTDGGGGAGVTSNMHVGLGIGGSTTLFGQSTLSTTDSAEMLRFDTAMGTLISISENAAVQFDTIDVNLVSTSETDTCDLHVWVTYSYEPNLRS